MIHSITAKGEVSRKFTTIPRDSQPVDIHREDDFGRGTRLNGRESSHVPKSEAMQPHFLFLDLGYGFKSSLESLDEMGSKEKERHWIPLQRRTSGNFRRRHFMK